AGGEEIASRLLEPFQSVKSAESRAAWFNTSVVSAFFTTLESTEKKIAHLDSGFHLIPDFISSLGKSERTNLRNKLKMANLIFWPYCDNHHWYLLLLERVRDHIFTIKCLDGFNDTAKHAALIQIGRALLRKIDSRSQILDQDDMSYLIPQQDNGDDCGAVISYYAFKKAERHDLSFYADYRNYACNYAQVRLQMAKQFVESIRMPEPSRTYLPQSSSSSSRNKSKVAEKPSMLEDKRRSVRLF
ncbi:MAG TPA: Ulp1 family isopeptidase, partial [Candidatus Berkiella sp.]|nr:Ulp1 family isopeptidase [Candidatus Berkiella sp.]